MRYSEPQPISREEVISHLASDDLNLVAASLIRMSLSEGDWEWAERTCLMALKSDSTTVKVAAIQAIGHIARRFHTLHLDVVLPVIAKLRDQTEYRGSADDALDDIAIFVSSGNQ